MKNVKRVGPDWNVLFENPKDGETIESTIYGVHSIEDLIDVAHADAVLPKSWKIIMLERKP